MIVKIKEKKEISSPGAVATLLKAVLKAGCATDREKEHCWVIGVDSRNMVKYLELVSLGTLNASLVHPREVFRTAISKGVASIIMGHNHPSGTAVPSDDDKRITHKIYQAGEILSINLLDHIIITPTKAFFSFKKEYMLK